MGRYINFQLYSSFKKILFYSMNKDELLQSSSLRILLRHKESHVSFVPVGYLVCCSGSLSIRSTVRAIRSMVFISHRHKNHARDHAHHARRDTHMDIAINRTISAMRRDGFKSGQI